MDLSNFTDDDLDRLEAGDLSSFSDAQLDALQGNAATAGSRQLQPSKFKTMTEAEPVAPQKIRSIAEGATFGFSGEMEAMLRSKLGNEDFDTVLSDIQGKMGAYRKEQPASALSYELGGAFAVPAVAATKLLGQAPSVLRTIGVLGGTGAVAGGTTAFGTGEGGFLDRTARVPLGTALGAVAGPVLAGGGMLASKGLKALVDVARRKFGGRAAQVVETEVQRIARETGLTDDEIVAQIRSGEILAENETVKAAVRALATSGGDASTILSASLKKRPEELRKMTIQELNRVLFPDATGNVRKVVGESDEVARVAEGKRYKAAFERGGVMSQDLLEALSDGIRRSPDAGRPLQEGYRAQTGKTPFFSVKNGEVIYDRPPTLVEAEMLMRGLRDLADSSFRTGAGAAGKGYKEAANNIKNEINKASTLFESGGPSGYGGVYRPVVPTVRQTRKEAANVRGQRDAFDYGKKIFGQNSDQVAIDFESVAPEALSYLRAGVMDAIRNKMATGNKLTFLKKLNDETTKEGQILRSVYPADELEKALGVIGRAAKSQQASGYILGGSATAPTQAQASRIGMDMSIPEVGGALMGNLFSQISLAAKLIQNAVPTNLSDKQRAEVAKILVSEDPELVNRALRDETALAEFAQKANNVINRLPAGLLGSGSFAGGLAGGNLSTSE